MLERRHRAIGLGVATALVLILAMAPSAPAQFCTDMTDDITLSMWDINLRMIEVFYLSDFDPSDTGAHPILFSFKMVNNGEDRTLTLGFQVSSDQGQLVQGESDPFILGADFKEANNQDLSNSSHEFQLGSYDISAAGDELEQVVTQTGYLPEGEYSFRISLIEEGSGELEYCTLNTYVSNPRTVELTFPGGPFGASLPLESTLLPQFQWESRATTFNFRLCPVLPGDGSGEEVMENQPVFEDLEFDTGFMGTHSYLYPPSAEVLDHGRSYCWQVEAVVFTSSGDILFPSEIYCFEMQEGASLTPYDDLLHALLLLLPPGMLDDVLAKLQGFHSTGEITVDGIQVSEDELPLLLEALLSQGWGVGRVEVDP